MTLQNLILSFLTLIYFSTCSNLTNNYGNKRSNDLITKNKKNSKVIEFEYGGYGDTVVALIYGNIFELKTTKNSSETLQPVSNVSIKVQTNNKTVFTDTSGQFSLGLDKGVFNLLITKQGYQTLRLTNYVSDPDQISNTKIVLEKGKDTTVFEIPKWTK